MKMFFTWLLVFGVLAGFSNRVFAIDPCEDSIEQPAGEHSGHEHCPDHPCEPAHDQKCPVEHHHSHGYCGHAMPLAADTNTALRPKSFIFSLRLMSWEVEKAPDEPVMELDKPPLI